MRSKSSKSSTPIGDESSPQPHQAQRRVRPIRVRIISSSISGQPRQDAISTGSSLGTNQAFQTSTMLKTGDARQEITNNDHCDACGGIGRFVCCDNCPRSFHFACTEPPMSLTPLPEGQWFCKVCQYEKQHRPSHKRRKGLFQSLLDNLDKTNPSVFSLPHDIKSYFKGVGSNSDESYVDLSEIKPIKYGRNGFIEERDLQRLKDKYGNAVLCYKCGKSSFKGTILSCDHCNLHWHLDCLSPPMTAPPSTTRRWMCPNHVDHVLPKKRRPKHQIIQDGRRRPNDGDIDIVLDKNQSESRKKNIESETFILNNIKYRLPEMSIKLDFMDRVDKLHRKRKSDEGFDYESSLSSPPSSLDISEDVMQVEDEPKDQDSTQQNFEHIWFEQGERAMVQELQRRSQVLAFLDPNVVRNPQTDRLNILIKAALDVENNGKVELKSEEDGVLSSWMKFPETLEPYVSKSNMDTLFSPRQEQELYLHRRHPSNGLSPDICSSPLTKQENNGNTGSPSLIHIDASDREPIMTRRMKSARSRQASESVESPFPSKANGCASALEFLKDMTISELKQILAIRELIAIREPSEVFAFFRQQERSTL